jgi:uncharacterized protein (TIGR03083 family)
MESALMVASIATESRGLADIAQPALGAPIEHCPGWTMRDLVTHVGDVQWFWSEIVERRATDRSKVTASRPDDRRDDCLAWFRSQSARLVAALSSVDDATPLWTWWQPSQNAAFVKRRQLLEVAVHGWDARNAAGQPSDINGDIAELGLVEFIEVMHDLRADHPAPPPLHLVATDSNWTDTMLPSAPGAPLTINGTRSDLLLRLWGRQASNDPAVDVALAAIDLS